MLPHADIEKEMRRLIQAAQDQNFRLRALGGLAVRIRCSSAALFNRERSCADIDLITDRKGGALLESFFSAQGYTPNKNFNTLNGGSRQLFYDENNNRQVDIFIGEFEMCHRLPLSDRLHLEPVTAPLAELFLSKAQIVELNLKDAIDLTLLLYDHPIGDKDGETINGAYIASLCAKDWGLFTTVEITLTHLEELLQENKIALTPEQKIIVNERIRALRSLNNAVPKSLSWKARAQIGKRVRWYQEVEEVKR
ncbi:MAG: hypothetical protein IT308_06465 [Anaerolineaceae bacterium]|nr:hypothetical protein [Anaerolineaceae bacterium]